MTRDITQQIRLDRARGATPGGLGHIPHHKTLQNACRSLYRTDNFFNPYALPTIHDQLQLPSLPHPPVDLAIPMFWSMIHHSTFPSSRSRGHAPYWDTVRSQRSAISLYSAWTAAVCFPHTSYKDGEDRVLSAAYVSPSNNILSRFTASGI